MALPIRPPYPPMEARLVETIPTGKQWLYEPKWDGFRCIALRDGHSIHLQSKSGQPLHRYFPEVVASLKALKAQRFILDGEIVVPVDGELSFDELLQRIHPAESRIRKLSTERPAIYIVFDLLANERGAPLIGETLEVRRETLETFARRFFPSNASIRLSPATTDLPLAKKWFQSRDGALDGVMAKRLDLPYRSGERDGMQKIKHLRSAECVVGGFRYGSKETKTLGSLLLGLYNDAGKLDHVGFCSSLTRTQRQQLTPKIEKLKAPASKGGGFSGKSPGGKSRWSTERTGEWEPVLPKLVVEVQFDHFTGGRFRHGTKFLRWRPEKSPHQCTMDQLRSSGPMLDILTPKRRKSA